MKEYIIYYKPKDEFVSTFGDDFRTSEFSEEYALFNSIEQAKSVIMQLKCEHGLDPSDLEIEEY